MSFFATCVDPKCPDSPMFKGHEYGPGCPSFRRMWECVCCLPEILHTVAGAPLGCPGFMPKWTMPSSEPRH